MTIKGNGPKVEQYACFPTTVIICVFLFTFFILGRLVTSFCVVLLYLFRISGAIIRFKDRCHFCSCGVFSINLALYANSLIRSIDFWMKES